MISFRFRARPDSDTSRVTTRLRMWPVGASHHGRPRERWRTLGHTTHAASVIAAHRPRIEPSERNSERGVSGGCGGGKDTAAERAAARAPIERHCRATKRHQVPREAPKPLNSCLSTHYDRNGRRSTIADLHGANTAPPRHSAAHAAPRLHTASMLLERAAEHRLPRRSRRCHPLVAHEQRGARG